MLIVMGFAIPSESDQIIQRKEQPGNRWEQPQNVVGVTWVHSFVCLACITHTAFTTTSSLCVHMQQWLEVALGVAGKVWQKPSRYVQEHVQVGFSQLTNHIWFSSHANHLVHYILCFVFHRKAGRAEVEKEYRRKVTSAPWDLLRSVILAV